MNLHRVPESHNAETPLPTLRSLPRPNRRSQEKTTPRAARPKVSHSDTHVWNGMGSFKILSTNTTGKNTELIYSKYLPYIL